MWITLYGFIAIEVKWLKKLLQYRKKSCRRLSKLFVLVWSMLIVVIICHKYQMKQESNLLNGVMSRKNTLNA